MTGVLGWREDPPLPTACTDGKVSLRGDITPHWYLQHSGVCLHYKYANEAMALQSCNRDVITEAMGMRNEADDDH